MLPCVVTEDEHAMLSALPVLRLEALAEQRPHAERVEEVRGDDRARRTDRFAANPERRGALAERGDLFEGARLLLPVLEVRRGDGIARLRVDPVVLPDHRDAIRRAKRQRTKQHAVDDGEHRGVRADTERQGEDDDGSEAGTLAHQAQGVAEILEKHVGAPLLAEKEPGVGKRSAGARNHARLVTPRSGAAAVPGGGELGLPLGAELSPGPARGQARDERDEAAEEIRHRECRASAVRGFRSVSPRRRAHRRPPA